MNSVELYYLPMRAAKEQSLMIADVVEVEETSLIGSNTKRRNIGWVKGFPDARVKNRTGDASAIEVVVTEGPDSELTVTYALQGRFPVRLDDYSRTIARVPKESTLASDMADVRITRLSRLPITK